MPASVEYQPYTKLKARFLHFERLVKAWLVVLLLVVGLITYDLLKDLPKLPPPDSLWQVRRSPGIEFLDSNGDTIAYRGPRYGRKVTPQTLPPHVVNAFLAIEDKDFYHHYGINMRTILRAFWVNTKAGETIQGGSTITQQLVKNLFLSSDQTFKRKAQEAVLAMQLETQLSKDEILTLYLNRIYMGQRTYGIDAASRRYFNKPAAELELHEAALLAAIPKAPSQLAPTADLEATQERQEIILDRMLALKMITEAQYHIALKQKVDLSASLTERHFGYALDMATKKALTIAPDRGDLILTLTLDATTQETAHLALNEELEKARKARHRASQGAAIVMDTRGAIKAVIGGKSYQTSQFNRATQAKRQPGSSFKTFVYASAMEHGYTPGTRRVDSPVNIRGWRPKNYHDYHRGLMTLSEALEKSINTIAARLGAEIGARNIVELSKRFGISTDLRATPAIALGAYEVTLIDMVSAYGTFASGGHRVEPYILAKIHTADGQLLYEYREPEKTRIYQSRHTAYMIRMLNRVIESGTGTEARIKGHEIAGKTGTSQKWRDAWFIGFNREYVGGVWVGNDNDRPMNRVTGGQYPARIWKAMMKDLITKKSRSLLLQAEIEQPLTTSELQRLEYYRNLSVALKSAF